MNSKTIWNERQNKPTLVVRDICNHLWVESGVVFAHLESDIYEILLRRGVFKWLFVRRQIIKLKNAWRDRLTVCYNQPKTTSAYDTGYKRGYQKALEECRAEVRALCHSDRWVCPDNDSQANKWLDKRSKLEIG